MVGKKYLPLWIMSAVAGVLYLFHLGSFPLYDYDEAIYARIAVATLQHHSFFTLYDLTKTWFEKPPLYIWAVMTSVRTFGISEWSVRLPSALCGVAAVALVYLLALEMTDDATVSTLAAAALLLMPFFYFEGRQSRMDIPVIAAMLFALFAFIKGQKGKRWFILMGVALAAAVMIKSVIGLLVGVPIVLFAYFFGEWAWIRSKYFWAGIGVGLLLLLPWHFYELWHFGNGFWSVYFTQQVFARAVTGLGGDVTTFTYLQLLWFELVPWTQVAILLIPLFFWMKWNDVRTKLAALGIGTAVIYFALFAAARTKIGEYLLPLFPFLALFIAAGLSSLRNIIPSLPRWIWLAIVSIILSIGLYFTLRIQFVDFDRWYVPAYDERGIGERIAAYPSTIPVYSYEIPQVESLLFYGERPIIQRSSDAPPQRGPFLFITQNRLTPELMDIPAYTQAKLAYDGDVFMLLFVSSSTSP